jgi:hypothetical protein
MSPRAIALGWLWRHEIGVNGFDSEYRPRARRKSNMSRRMGKA